MSGGMSTASIVMLGVTAATTAASAMTAMKQGQAQQQEENYQAAQENQVAGQAQASGERAMIEQNRQTAYVESNAVAAGAGSGGTATDPTVVSDVAQIGAEGNYRAQTALYQGNAKAQSLRNQANADIYQGNLDQSAGTTKAEGSLVQGASSLFSKYAVPFTGGGGSDLNNPVAYGLNSSGYGNTAYNMISQSPDF